MEFLPFHDLIAGTDPPVEWLIPNFVPRGSLIALAGEPGTGKSFFSYTLCLALATGTTFLHWPLSPRRILYFDQENSRPDCTEYGRRAWIGLGRPDLGLVKENFHFAQFQLGSKDWAVKAAAGVAVARPDLILIDTTTPACSIDDENDNAEATQAITSIRRLMSLTNPMAACIALKHARVRAEGDGYTLRGAKAWEGAVDAIIYQTKSAGRPRTDGLSVTKLTPAKTRAFGLREVVTIDPEWTEIRAGIKLRRI